MAVVTTALAAYGAVGSYLPVRQLNVLTTSQTLSTLVPVGIPGG